MQQCGTESAVSALSQYALTFRDKRGDHDRYSWKMMIPTFNSHGLLPIYGTPPIRRFHRLKVCLLGKIGRVGVTAVFSSERTQHFLVTDHVRKSNADPEATIQEPRLACYWNKSIHPD
jgi:hypothetical protein